MTRNKLLWNIEAYKKGRITDEQICADVDAYSATLIDTNTALAEVPSHLNKVNWLMLSEAQSECGKFKFKHHSTSDVIQLRKDEGEDLPTDVWFDYAEWKNFLKFIKDIS